MNGATHEQHETITREELLEVSGIGEVEAQRYGRQFLNAILEWEER